MVNDTKCGIRHGKQLSDVEESVFSLSSVASVSGIINFTNVLSFRCFKLDAAIAILSVS